jgi:1-acyl-sn-glycerol-3-phosphate acyltransferase
MDSRTPSTLIPIPDTISASPFYKSVRFACTLFARTYLRLTVSGASNIPESGGVIVVSNHQSHLDVPILGLSIPRESRFPGKAELFSSSLYRSLLLGLGGFPLVRGEGDRKAISFSQTVLEMGGVLVMFPEGTRSRDGSIAPFHRGLGVLALKTGAPIVPAALFGTGERMGIGGRFPKPGRISVLFGTPLYPPTGKFSPSDLKRASQDLSLEAESAVRDLYRTLAGKTS